MKTLKEKKNEVKCIKLANTRERNRMMKSQMMAERNSFGNMKKKPDFMPTKNIPQVFGGTYFNAVGDDYVSGRDKLRLSMPDKSFLKDIPVWNVHKTNNDALFYKSTR